MNNVILLFDVRERYHNYLHQINVINDNENHKANVSYERCMTLNNFSILF